VREMLVDFWNASRPATCASEGTSDAALDAQPGHLYRNAQGFEYERFIVATVLAYTTPAMGHLFPMSALLTELRDRGHDIALRTLAAGVETGLGLGFATAAVDPRIEAITLGDADAPNTQVALKHALSAFARHAEYEGPIWPPRSTRLALTW
jgi:hypothetical protein